MAPTAPPVIRVARPEDAPGLAKALDAVAAERRFLAVTSGFDHHATLGFIHANIAQHNPHLVAVTHPGGQIVGWCDIVPAHPWDGARHVGRLGMGLLPPWRGRGLGTQLLRTALVACTPRRFHRVELEVFATNQRAIRLYERAGFRHEGRAVAACILDGRIEDILHMALLLGPLAPRQLAA